MANFTDEDYDNKLNEDLGWRRMEMIAVRKSLLDAQSLNQSSPLTRGLARALVSISYSHWEGYCKNSFFSYASLIAKRRPKVSAATDSLVFEHVQHLMKRAKSGDETAKLEVISTIRGESDSRVRIDKRLMSETNSNLRFDVLNSLFSMSDVPVGAFELKANLIDVNLCDARNSIAHGRDLQVSVEDACELVDNVIKMLDEIRTILTNQVNLKGYLATS